MSNLTISLDEKLIKRARVKAIQQGTSLSAKIREFVTGYATGAADRRDGEAAIDLLRMIEDVRREAHENAQRSAPQSDVQPLGRSLRDEMYEGDFRARARIEQAGDPLRHDPR